jgi:SNF family Na+-dependent transporter
VHPGQKFFDMGRTKWPREAYSVLSLIAFAADIANVARFPFLCYTFGGSAFLIPYFTFLVVTAFPLLYMELIIGQFVQQGSISVWKIVPIFKGNLTTF